ncbi:unnamed protein product [Mycena citricolor]|uniref:Uncharacterized protein n=1 Tax=Mycena citricolor TaxID=2018698 RepID=A0AAD2HQV1_9AGAR|nr:unnamed protein product [Mycena citricolor]
MEAAYRLLSFLLHRQRKSVVWKPFTTFYEGYILHLYPTLYHTRRPDRPNPANSHHVAHELSYDRLTPCFDLIDLGVRRTDRPLRDVPPASSVSTTPRSSTRPLRRKKHISVYRISAPAQSPISDARTEVPVIQRSQSMISSSDTADYGIDQRPSYPSGSTVVGHASRKPAPHNRAYSQSNIRFGPSRPYYSVIRKSMSGSVSRPVSPAVSDDISDDATQPISEEYPRSWIALRMGRPGSPETPVSRLHSGSSVSGEMELRMALAALERDQEPSFRFQYTPRSQGALKYRAKQFGRGLKEWMHIG